MESLDGLGAERARALTTLGVALCLLSAGAAMAIGLGALLLRGDAAGLAAVEVVPLSRMPSALASAEPYAWLSLGVLLLLLTPVVRVTGLSLWCALTKRRLALGAGLGVLAFLLLGLGRALWLAERAS